MLTLSEAAQVRIKSKLLSVSLFTSSVSVKVYEVSSHFHFILAEHEKVTKLQNSRPAALNRSSSVFPGKLRALEWAPWLPIHALSSTQRPGHPSLLTGARRGSSHIHTTFWTPANMLGRILRTVSVADVARPGIQLCCACSR